MKYYHIKNLSYLLILMFAASVAQASGWQKAVKCADKKVQKKYYASAADMYERILAHGCSKDSTWRDSSYSVKVKLADCYMKTGNTIKAESNYAEVVKAGKADPLATFNYARALQANGKYAEAKDQFDKVADNAPIKGKMAKGFGEVSEKAIHAEYKNSFNIERMSFNTTATEYAPAYYKKGLAYTSNKAERGQGSQRIMWNKEPFTDLYTVQEDGKGDLNVTDKLPNTINSKLNDGAASFNAAFDEVFFTRNNAKCKKHDQLQIFTSTFNGTEWSTPKLLNFEMPGANYAHPALSPDGNTLYFSSDMQGSGQGGMDLYTSRRNGSVWETPTNLGPLVNTAGNELFPYVAADSTLYFTSDGWPGYGCLDVFHTKMEGGKYGKVHNMGPNFNSQKDDLSLIVDSKNHLGYFASNRDGDDDIFSFKVPAKKEEKKEENLHSITLIDKKTNQPVSGARVEIADPRNPAEGTFYYTNDKGVLYYDRKIKADDDVKIAKEDYKTEVIKGSSIGDAKTFDFSLEEQKRSIKEDAQHPYTTILYYDLNTSILGATSKDTLREVIEKMKNPNNIVYVSGYADQHGSDTYNNGLSLRRVKEVVDYLASQGIETIRIRSAYFGAVKLSPECKKDAKCVEDTNRRNRRVEVKVGNQ
jgi:outer membrane protein OmpA-like peptidoglycan-associated protein/tetratricopeptide (TPR) repeat protein